MRNRHVSQYASMSTIAKHTESERLALSAADLAGLLGISQRHVWKLAASGRLPKPIRLGRSVRWLRADVLAHLEELKHGKAGG